MASMVLRTSRLLLAAPGVFLPRLSAPMRATLAAPRPLVAGISSLARREPSARSFGVRALAAEAAPAAVDLRSPAPPEDFSSVFGTSVSAEPPPQTVPTVPLSESGLCAETVAALQARGITGLFDVQASVLRPALAGRDVFARARTGSGKTLAFALPIVEALLGVRGEKPGGEQAAGEKAGSPAPRPVARDGRAPKALVLAPTRELAVQVEREFARCAPGLRTLCCYGGAPSGPQIRTLRSGVDVVVGTPGRVQDLMDGGHLTLSAVRTLVLDEADHMLNVGFAKDVEAIMDAAPSPRQTMLFSATMPAWIRQALGRYLTDPVRVDLSGGAGEPGRAGGAGASRDSGTLAEGIQPVAVCVPHDARRGVLADLVRVHSGGGASIVFVQTKREADEVAAALASQLPTAALHGDMSQAEREKVLADFRRGSVRVLVATDVAARGLDIPNVDLVVHYDCPRDVESFLHRSGRTGRAGRAGTTLLVHDARDAQGAARVLQRAGALERASRAAPPAPEAVLAVAARAAAARLDACEPELRAHFAPAARALLSQRDPQAAMEAALAALSGLSGEPRPRGLLSVLEGRRTLLLCGPGAVTQRVGGVRERVREALGKLGLREEDAEVVGRVRVLRAYELKREHPGAAFDLSEPAARALLAAEGVFPRGVTLEAVTELPDEPLVADDERRDGRRDGRRGGGRGGGGREWRGRWEGRDGREGARDGGRGGGGRGRFSDDRDGFRSERPRSSPRFGDGGFRGRAPFGEGGDRKRSSAQRAGGFEQDRARRPARQGFGGR